MHHVLRKLALPLLLASSSTLAAPAFNADWRQVAPDDGWAGMDGGTSGGLAAPAERVFRVRDIDALRQAFKQAGREAKIVIVEGVIDATGGKPFESKADQAARGQIRVPSNTSLIGADKAAGFVNADLVLKDVRNVIIRNLTIENPWDAYPQWDPHDGPAGHWNSEYDGITIDASQHVWVDHVSLSDGARTDDQNGRANGQEVQHHDGALDLKNASDFVTISHCVFRLHDKNNLVGHSDSKQSDAGHLRVTFHHNLFQDVIQRAPRVRYGQVHVYNNAYLGSKTHPVYAHQYSIGIGVEASVLSEHNAFEIGGATTLCDIVKPFGGSRFEDHGSLLNGAPPTAAGPCKGGEKYAAVGWTLPYRYALLPAGEVMAKVKAGAGPR